MLKYIPLIILASCITISCNLKNPKEPTPTYIHVDSFTFKGNSNLVPPELSRSHDINSVFAYYNGNPVGIFDLPATIPVITNGRGKMTLFPGIAVSGFNNFLAAYPFYKPDTFSFDEEPGKQITRVAVTQYFDKTLHFLDCGFENTSIFFYQEDNTVPILTTFDKNDIFEGTGAGKITLKLPADTLSENYTFTKFNIPENTDAYIELNYKATVPFYVGLKSELNGTSVYEKRYLAGIYPSTTWKKFYLAVKDFAAQYRGDNYTLYIKSYLPEGTASGTVLLDNIQLVYF